MILSSISEEIIS